MECTRPVPMRERSIFVGFREQVGSGPSDLLLPQAAPIPSPSSSLVSRELSEVRSWPGGGVRLIAGRYDKQRISLSHALSPALGPNLLLRLRASVSGGFGKWTE